MYAWAEAYVAGDRTATLTHAVNFTLFDIQPSTKRRIGEDVRGFDDALTAEAGDDDIDNLCAQFIFPYSAVSALVLTVLT